ncbi:MAG: hypothetical protein ACJ8G2_10040 [Burkholderiales bacterium]|jgi:hypothetical protein
MMFDPSSNLTGRPSKGLYNVVQEGLQTLFHLLLFSLLLLGFGGFLYKALRSGGWIETWLTNLWNQHPAMTIVALLGTIAGIGGARRFFNNTAAWGKRGDLLVYGCLALGLFFAFKLLVTGSL